MDATTRSPGPLDNAPDGTAHSQGAGFPGKHMIGKLLRQNRLRKAAQSSAGRAGRLAEGEEEGGGEEQGEGASHEEHASQPPSAQLSGFARLQALQHQLVKHLKPPSVHWGGAPTRSTKRGAVKPELPAQSSALDIARAGDQGGGVRREPPPEAHRFPTLKASQHKPPQQNITTGGQDTTHLLRSDAMRLSDTSGGRQDSTSQLSDSYGILSTQGSDAIMLQASPFPGVHTSAHTAGSKSPVPLLSTTCDSAPLPRRAQHPMPPTTSGQVSNTPSRHHDGQILISRSMSLPTVVNKWPPVTKTMSGCSATDEPGSSDRTLPLPPIASRTAARRSSLPFDFVGGEPHSSPLSPSIVHPTGSVAAAKAAAQARRWLSGSNRRGSMAGSTDGVGLCASPHGERCCRFACQSVGGPMSASPDSSSRLVGEVACPIDLHSAGQSDSGSVIVVVPADAAGAGEGLGNKDSTYTAFPNVPRESCGGSHISRKGLASSKSRPNLIAGALREAGTGMGSRWNQGLPAAAGGGGSGRLMPPSIMIPAAPTRSKSLGRDVRQ